MTKDTNSEIKKLYKSEYDKLIGGVIAGIGEYFNVDPTLLRLVYVVLVLLTGVFPGAIAYIIAYFIIPDRPMGSRQTTGDSREGGDEIRDMRHEKEAKATSSKVVKPELDEFDIQMEEKDKYMPGERKAPEVASELAADSDFEGELKKPNWPVIESQQKTVDSRQEEGGIKTNGQIEYPEAEPEMPTLDSLLEEQDGDLELNDIIDE